jgi:hypothetical protein
MLRDTWYVKVMLLCSVTWRNCSDVRKMQQLSDVTERYWAVQLSDSLSRGRSVSCRPVVVVVTCSPGRNNMLRYAVILFLTHSLTHAECCNSRSGDDQGQAEIIPRTAVQKLADRITETRNWQKYKHTHTHTLSLSHSHTHIITLIHTHTHTHTRKHTHTLSHSHTLTLIHTHTHSRQLSAHFTDWRLWPWIAWQNRVVRKYVHTERHFICIELNWQLKINKCLTARLCISISNKHKNSALYVFCNCCCTGDDVTARCVRH